MSGILLVSKIKKNSIRVGRGAGSGMGKTSGRGHKGQKARSGGSIRRGFEGGQMPLYRRLPKRGFHNFFRKDVQQVQLSDLITYFPDGAEIDANQLLGKGLIIKRDNTYVKVLNDIKELNKKFTVKVQGISASARALIEKAGGKVELAVKSARTKDFVKGK